MRIGKTKPIGTPLARAAPQARGRLHPPGGWRKIAVMMTLAVSTYSLLNWRNANGKTFEQSLDWIATSGVRAVEFAPIGDEAGLITRRAGALRKRCDRLGLAICSYCVGAEFLVPARKQRQLVERLKRDIDVGAVLGVRTMRHDVTRGEGAPVFAEAVRQALELGFYISFAGVVTFPRANDLRETARLTPIDRLLSETDSPYLAPAPYRGKRNEPAYVIHVVDALAKQHGLTRPAMAEQIRANFQRLFGLAR